MKDHFMSAHNPYLVLFSNTHVIFLRRNEQRLAETLKKQDLHFRNGLIEPVDSLPAGTRTGKVYRHCSPID